MEDKKNLIWPALLGASLTAILIMLTWCDYTGIIKPDITARNMSVSAPVNLDLGRIFWNFLRNISKDLLLIKGVYLASLAALPFLSPNAKVNRNLQQKDKKYIFIYLALFMGIFLYGYGHTRLFTFYLYPASFIICPLLLVKAVNSMRRPPVNSGEIIGLSFKTDSGWTFIWQWHFDFSRKFKIDYRHITDFEITSPVFYNRVSYSNPEEMCFDFSPVLNMKSDIPGAKPESGTLRIHSPQQGILVQGGAGAGKSASIIEPILVQAVQKGFTGVIYDFKGNPPTLGSTVYNALKNHGSPEYMEETVLLFFKRKIKLKPVTFGIINFVDMAQTVRCNPLNPKYISNGPAIKEAAQLIMFSVNKSWVKKKDFWADNAISLLIAVIKMLRNNYPDKCTLPHAIAAILSDGDTLMNWLASDEEIAVEARPALTAFKRQAEGQTAGSISSVQLPMTILRSEELFWVCGKDEFDLDISNPENPRFLCVANNPPLKKALAPAIGLIIKCCMNNMNQQGKRKAVLAMDEFPQIYIPEIWDFPATARSNKCVTLLGFQLEAQLEDEYGPLGARSTIGNLGNQFNGMTNEVLAAEKIVKLFGPRKFTDFSYSESDSGSSQSESTKSENIFNVRDIMGLQSGHLVGKIAGGVPALFSARFSYMEKDKFDGNVYMNNPDGSRKKLWKPLTIPKTSYVVDDDQLDKRVLDAMIKANFEKINNDIREILKDFEIGSPSLQGSQVASGGANA